MNIIDLLNQWVSDPRDTTRGKRISRITKADYHYYTEIIRYFNQIRFIVNKTKRSIAERDDIDIAYYLYITYRYFWEKSTFKDIIRDIDYLMNAGDEKLLYKYYKRLSTWNWDISLQNKDKMEVLSIKYAIPSFLIQKLMPVLSYKQIQHNFVAMDQRARKGTIYLRITYHQKLNEEISDHKAFLIDYFGEKGVRLESVENFPFLLQANVLDKSKIVMDSYYKQNHLIFQEKASASSVLLLNPQPNEIIVDMCAAPGMKTSLISQISTGQSIIIAGDFHAQRINDMVAFLSSSGFSNVYGIQWDGIQLPLEEESVDRILLDAPCTGSGTFTSNPELKWKQSNKFLRRNVLLQEKLLTAALNALKVGGILVYSVCSLYPEEGEHQIQKIIDQYVTPAVTPSWLPPSYFIDNSYIKGTGRFLPAEHNTIGFFVGKMIKIKG